MKFDDEDYAYERARQQKVDNIAYLNRPQRYERVDTHKRIPFVTPHIPKPTKLDVIATVIAVAAWVYIVFHYWPNK